MSIPVFKEGIQIGDDPIYIRPTYIDLSGGELRNVGYINRINSIENLFNVINIGSLGHVDYIYADILNAKTISNIENISNVNILEADVIQNVKMIKNVGILSSNTINVGTIESVGLINAEHINADNISNVQFLSALNATINTISNVDNIFAVNADIKNISNVENITAITANLNTIQNVTKGFFLDASINVLSHVDTAYFVSATINAGTFSDVTIATATLDLALFRDATIQNVNISAGSIFHVIMYASDLNYCVFKAGAVQSAFITNCTLSGLTINAATISNLQVIGEIQGDNIISANNIQNLAIRFYHLETGLQGVIGSTLWEAEHLNYGNGGYVVSDPTASNGQAVECITKSDPDYFVYGPYRTLPPGDYFIHFRIKGVRAALTIPYFVIDVNDFFPPSGSVLASATLTFLDVYDDFPEWRVFTLLAPGIKANHTIETRVKLLYDQTLRVDYVKVEPAGGFANYPFYFKINTDHIEDFAITSSKIGDLQIKSNHIGNFQIKNAHIDTLQITYDRLIKPPIGWNEVVNPSFEYGMWEQITTSTFYKAKFGHSGEYSAGMVYLMTLPSSPAGNASEWIKLNTLEHSVVVASWIYAKLQEGYACSWVRFYDANKNEIFALDFNTVNGPYDTNGWRIDKVTLAIPSNAKYARVGVWADDLVRATIYFDDFSFMYGSQYMGFTDTTVAKNRWLPDTYYSKETARVDLASGSTTVELVVLPLTIDYRARILIWAGAFYEMYSKTGNLWQYTSLYIKVDGDAVGVSEVGGIGDIVDFRSHFAMMEEATISPGVHTIKLVAVTSSYWPSGNTIAFVERYLRVLAGSYYES
ncbi:MAG: hypothetical protein DRN15_10345 [Thermoprotei archaeon]|nr:MAG: hypothetical protein DRN15_10345 [Thermoprotei archaeon]